MKTSNRRMTPRTAVRTTTANIVIDQESAHLAADLNLPDAARALVIFAHGSGSSRLSPRNAFVASSLNESGFATLLADLLTPGEEAIGRVTAGLRFDIPLLARRLAAVTAWSRSRSDIRGLAVGYFGASTGAAAAL